MPIFEYTCKGCGLRFEKLVRGENGESALRCPSCGGEQLQKEFSTFAAHASAGKSDAAPMCPSGGVCPTPGACGLN